MSSPILNPFDLSGKTILVTGASSGIGRDTAVLLSQLGARVILVARNEERLKETCSLMEPGDHVVSAFDLTHHDETSAWMSRLATAHGQIFGLVHLAGISHTEAIRFLDLEKLEEVFDVNVKTAFSLTKAFRQKPVRANPEARIVLVSSVSATRGYSGMTTYSASKGAVLAMTRPLAVELAREGIRVNCIVPGLVQTEMTIADKAMLPPKEWEALEQAHPLGVGKPRDISLPIAFLLSPAALWMTGQSIVVDGGLTIK
jgi:NAD(P)-dependent dehydrogenase (short-subunit alcohol dehydrogenase family)